MTVTLPLIGSRRLNSRLPFGFPSCRHQLVIDSKTRRFVVGLFRVSQLAKRNFLPMAVFGPGHQVPARINPKSSISRCSGATGFLHIDSDSSVGAVLITSAPSGAITTAITCSVLFVTLVITRSCGGRIPSKLISPR